MPRTAVKPRSTSSSSRSKKPSGLYSPHPGVAMVQKWIAEMPAKTGRTLDQWMKFIKKEGPRDVKARRQWLKTEHGMGENTAGWLADRASDDSQHTFADEDPDLYLAAAEQYVQDMYAGAKAGLRPIYDKLLKLGLGIGPQAKACPCKTIVPLYRNHVFAQIKPTTRTRIDLGLALGAMLKEKRRIAPRLIDTGGFAKKDRITHRIEVDALDQIDDELKKWLKIAYDLDA